MAGNSAFVPVMERGWRGGLTNLMRAGFGKWFRTRLWWGQALMWTLIINSMVAGILSQGGSEVGKMEVVNLYTLFSGMFTSIAIVIIMQDALVGEKETGTAAWVLSKPVSRTAFVLSKLFPNLFSVLVTMLLIPGLVAFILFAFFGISLAPLNFLAGLGVLWVDLAFYLTLTLMLGAFFEHRAAVIGIPLALAFGQQILFGLVPSLARVLPWTLAVPLGESNSIAGAIMQGETPGDWLPLISALVMIVIFTVVALWRFEREEF